MPSIVITGFMGTGKSTVARLLSARLGRGCVDIDEVVAAQTGTSIARIFDEQGEARFRQLEREALERVLEEDGIVVATGGGTLVESSAMKLALSRGWVVALEASIDTIWTRIGDSTERPLMAGGREALTQLKRDRDGAYQAADCVVVTDERAPEDIVQEILRRMPEGTGAVSRLRRLLEQSPGTQDVRTLEVPLGERTYMLEFLAGGRHALGCRVRELFPGARKVTVVTNPVVGGFYYAEVASSLEREGLSSIRVDIPDGESAKSLAEVDRVLDSLIERRIERREPLVALGGGVVGDLTGFAASIYLRGVPFIQVPTTLLAQVDSSIGGKTGVNSPRGKNLIGSFYQPSHVLMDVEVLRTLPDVEFRAGLAEVIKYGAIRDLPFLEYLEQRHREILGRDTAVLEQIIFRSCANKAEVVVADEREQGERALLNFGHTLGHAFETLGAYHGLRHGQAVAIGMVFAAQLSRVQGLCDSEDVERLVRLLGMYGLPTTPPPCTVAECLEVMTLDKKMRSGKVQFVVLEALGRARLEPLRFDDIAPVLKDFLEVTA